MKFLIAPSHPCRRPSASPEREPGRKKTQDPHPRQQPCCDVTRRPPIAARSWRGAHAPRASRQSPRVRCRGWCGSTAYSIRVRVCEFDANTEFITAVPGQCAAGAVPTSAGVAFGGGDSSGGVLAPAPVVVAAPPTPAMNQLGTVYATKRRRRNGKRYRRRSCVT